MDYKKIGEFIQIRRKYLGLTQRQLADKLKVTDKAVSKWETGLGCPDVSILSKLSDIVGVSIGEILNGQYNEDLKNNSDFIKNAVDYSKKITEENFYTKLRKILYIILIVIVLYISFMGIKQFIYINGETEFKSSTNDIAYIEYEKLKENTKIMKENNYFTNINPDYLNELNYLVKRIEYINLLNSRKVIIKNTDLLNIKSLIININSFDNRLLHILEIIDKDNYKYYDLGISYVDKDYIFDVDGYFEEMNINSNNMKNYYSRKLYEYSEIGNSNTTLKVYYEQLGITLSKLNKILEFIIEVGDANENN